MTFIIPADYLALYTYHRALYEQSVVGDLFTVMKAPLYLSCHCFAWAHRTRVHLLVLRASCPDDHLQVKTQAPIKQVIPWLGRLP